MPQPSKRLQPRSYGAFRCVGADCEDTCCIGWGVNIDRPTYEAYQGSDDPELGPLLRELVTINTANTSDDNYAKIAITSTGCPFLSDGWCSIQKKLGESYLSKMCATYPRVMSTVDDVLYRSLHLSCPEAARLVLLDSSPMEFEEAPFADDGSRIGNLSMLSTKSEKFKDKPYSSFPEVRSFVISLLQNRNYALWKRLVMLAAFCDQLNDARDATPVVSGHRDAVGGGLFDESLNQLQPRPVAQFEIVVELIVGRIGSDYTSPRFLECYRQFMQGLEWTQESTMTELGSRYEAAYTKYCGPFMAQHEYILENYLVNSAHGKLFPFGPQEGTQNLNFERVVNTISKQYLLLAVYFAVIKTMLIGVAGFHKADFCIDHVLKVVQCCAKTFEHSLAFPEKALEILAGHGIKNCVSLATLLRN